VSKAEPVIQKYMSIAPYTIEARETMRSAIDMMAKNQIRHLPVVDRGELVGLVSDRDLKMAEGIDGIDPEAVPVIDVCHESPYKVEPNTLLSDVARTMAQKHYGSALVVSNGKLVGIFTTVDACRALQEILQQRFH
jgi:acetoin utilization protein AcuB